MKSLKLKISILVFSFVLSMYNSAISFAADISALNFNGDLIGKVIPDGSVIKNNELIGYITADGYVLDDADKVIGGIVPKGVAISENNSILGQVNNDGVVTNQINDVIGKVLPNGLVIDESYNVIGFVLSQGLIYNDSGEIIGRMSADGVFYDIIGEKVGFVTSAGYAYTQNIIDKKIELAGRLISSKMVVSSSGKFLGSIAPNGKIVDLNKKILGDIHANGFAYSLSKEIIGHIVENGYAFNTDGSYMGIISYNGEVVNKGRVLAYSVYGDRIINTSGKIIGFTLNMSSTANDLNGVFLGYISLNGQIVKGNKKVGQIGASGKVVNDKGDVIGLINKEGPIFDYLGRIKGSANRNGRVLSLNGIELGYMQGEIGYDHNGKEVGKVLNNKLNYDNNNFIGISGISSKLENNKKSYTISPYGYVYSENKVVGNNFSLNNLYGSDGSILTYITAMGTPEDIAINQVSRLFSSGLLFDNKNNLLGAIIEGKYATSFTGDLVGYLAPSNLIISTVNKIIAKILPDNNIVGIGSDSSKKYGKAGNANISVSVLGDYLGINNLRGLVVSAKNIIGKISSDGTVLDNQDALFGGTINSGIVVDKKCKPIGIIADDGSARTSSDAYIGVVLSNYQVVNEVNKVVGKIVYPTLVNGQKGEIIGSLTSVGNLLNYDNENLGCIDFNNNVRNFDKQVVGKVIPKSSVMNFDSKIIGSVDFYGKVIDNKGVDIAHIDLLGNITSKDSRNMGVLFEYQIAFDDNNIYIGRINSLGDIMSDTSEILGKVQYDGSLVLNSGQAGYALYDLYVYDNDNNAIGYISKERKAYNFSGELIGKLDFGFVLDKNNNVVARSKRDYNIRTFNNDIIGYLNLEGQVINTNNIIVGNINNKGEILDENDEVIAKADDLQYYYPRLRNDITEDSKKDDMDINTDLDTKIDVDIAIKEKVKDEKPKTNNLLEELKESDKIRKNHQVIGIAVTPGGKYIGDVYNTEDNSVYDENGLRVGQVDETGGVIDNDGNNVGNMQSNTPSSSAADRDVTNNWYERHASGATINPYSSGNDITNVGDGGGTGPGGRYNPERAAALANLQEKRRKSISQGMIKTNYNIGSYTGYQDNWGEESNISTLRVDMSNMITADKPIPAVLARSVISLGSAPVTAIVERNIYADSGRNVIIPAGSRILGGLQTADDSNRFDSSSGGVKMNISWSRIIRPDGISFKIENAQTGDAQGRGGGALGYVDEQLIKKYTLPMVATMASAGITYMMAASEDSESEVETSKQQAASDARELFMEQMDEIIQEIIESKSLIEAVTYIPAGTRVIIYPMVDLWLRTTKDNLDPTQETKRNTNQLIYNNGLDPVENSSSNNNTNSTQAPLMSGGNTSNAQQENNSVPLIADSSVNKNNNNSVQEKSKGALPPPSADGTITDFSEEDFDDGGGIELF